mmetsp:Transcript_11469/g.25343  ORF Transcript_11469/g.25343 Transcript_11469/m.25343 type:complete len:99 (-) Transcript_11469:358-654(-)
MGLSTTPGAWCVARAAGQIMVAFLDRWNIARRFLALGSSSWGVSGALHGDRGDRGLRRRGVMDLGVVLITSLGSGVAHGAGLVGAVVGAVGGDRARGF